jgi:hypothetical protein
MNIQETQKLTTTSWAEIPDDIENKWLIQGLITSDDCVGFSGKPKSGKSTSIRNIAAAVVTGGQYLGRKVTTPAGGRVLYLHLDRKDRPHQVKRELRNLGITEDNQHRLRLLTQKDVPTSSTNEQLCAWIARHVQEHKPDLLVIDLLTNFLHCRKGVNDYDGMQAAITLLQDNLSTVEYKGAFILSLHNRKSISEDNPFDDILGTTAIRGCLSTILAFRQYKKQKLYTVQSDQTHRDSLIGELDEMIVNRDHTGRVSLGGKFEDLKKEEKKDVYSAQLTKVFNYIARNEGKTSDELAEGLVMSKKTLLPLLESLASRIISKGEGKKGDPKRYFAQKVIVNANPSAPATATRVITPTQCRTCTNPVPDGIEFCAVCVEQEASCS